MKFACSTEVSEAIDRGAPVVALESTVIAHGLPHPKNLETALEMENKVRENGAVPATIAVLDGIPTVGLNESQLELLASSPGLRKVSIRDLPIVAAGGGSGATTVAGTLHIAHQAGIGVFATGGIGGVHRGAVPDVSADLPKLASTPMVVVCAGAKIVLDLSATREWLETNGIAVLGWKTEKFPAFYGVSSGLPVDETVHTASEVVEIARARDALGLKSAIIVAVPVPDEFAIGEKELGSICDEAINDAARQGIAGKNLTPFLLSKLAEKSGGDTIETNIRLLLQNAEIAAAIAVDSA